MPGFLLKYIKAIPVWIADDDGNPVSGGGGGGGASGYAQGSTTSGQSGPLTQAAVVTGDQSYTVGTTQPLNLTPNGRLKVGVSNAGNINPAAQLATTLTADLVSAKYYATRATWSDGWTGSLQVDNIGNLYTATPDGADIGGGPTTATAYTDSTGAANGSRNAILKGMYVRNYGIGLQGDTAYAGSGNGTVVSILKGMYAQGADLTTASPVKQQKATSATSTNTAAATTSTAVAAANTNRTSLSIVNDSTSVAYVKLGTGASSTSYDFYMAGSVNGIPAQFTAPVDYTGVIHMIWVTANGNARVGERSA